MKLLILGSNGLLGNTITKYFLDRPDFSTFAILRNNSKLIYFKEKYHKNFLLIDNILDYDQTEKNIKSLSPDIIINCLGMTNKNHIINANKYKQNAIAIPITKVL